MLQNDKDRHSVITSDHAEKETKTNAGAGIWFIAGILLLAGLWLGIEISIIGAWIVFMVPVAALAILSILRCKRNIAGMCWVFGVIIGFLGAYFLWNNHVFFEHNIGAWVAEHFTFAAMFISVTTAFFNKKYIAVFTFAGYNLGIVAGELLGKVSYDPGGGRLHNGWLIWIFVFVGFVFAGGIVEAICKTRKERRIRNG